MRAVVAEYDAAVEEVRGFAHSRSRVAQLGSGGGYGVSCWMGTLKAVFFDVDGTLIDFDRDWRRAVAATTRALTERYRQIDRAALVAAYYAAATRAWHAIKDTPAPPWGNADTPRIVSGVWHAALAEWPAVRDAAAAHGARIYTRFTRTQVSVFPEVRDCLAVLRARYRLGAITNGSGATHLPKIAAAGLGEYFASVTTTDCGAGKPLLAIFTHALAWDIGGANNAGMISIWLNRTGAQPGAGAAVPTAEITSLRELPELLDRLA